ncbi:MAG: hypothetical protein LBB44_00355 [Endomicrobium sp.]|nr:hypothetical protein [Endomicrobium sp.]
MFMLDNVKVLDGSAIMPNFRLGKQGLTSGVETFHEMGQSRIEHHRARANADAVCARAESICTYVCSTCHSAKSACDSARNFISS